MGAAVEVFEGATAIGVGRERFLPVKTTNDLLLLRSDVYEVDDAGHLVRVADPAPLVDLDGRHYKTISAFDARFPAGAPSLRRASSLAVEGDWTFDADVTVVGAGPAARRGRAPDGAGGDGPAGLSRGGLDRLGPAVGSTGGRIRRCERPRRSPGGAGADGRTPRWRARG